MSTVRKRKRLSKNKKKNWRKSDITDVEEHLEDVRLQERTGGLVATKSDDQLFFVDKVDIKDDAQHEIKRKGRAAKPLKCEALLQPDPNTKAFKVSHNVPIEKNLIQRKSIRVLSKQQEQKDLKNQQQEEKDKKKIGNRKRRHGVVEKDLWSDDKPEDNTDQFYLQYTRKAPIKVPQHLNSKVSEVAAVELPAPGQSYNPTFFHHQQLLLSANKVEMKKQKEEKRLFRAVDSKVKKISVQENEDNWMSEMSAGLEKTCDGEEETYTEEELSRVSTNPPVRRESKKTEKQRRKIKEEKKKLKKLKADKLKKIKEHQLTSQLKSVKKKIRQEQELHKQQMVAREQQKLENKTVPKKLGKLKYEDSDIAIKLSEELVGTLRELKPEGLLLEDRYRSLQKRNILEPRKRAKVVRKYKVKYAEKNTHIEVTL